jgi:hypothetical protein
MPLTQSALRRVDNKVACVAALCAFYLVAYESFVGLYDAYQELYVNPSDG